ncbi:PP0621 family protein [Bordetella genomosp. 1]|uniref:Uncharacterized protein n=1 Tax=Bordetella genomosp. 1 TaxID=1395607 RepID=A0ABX4F2L7_9BORD|nr:PP0621 family protein [Bordetella genomosp. 1]OZI67994.1 hypothetical protein CAL27_00550 [Bordetella genomosp. 1]
MGKILFWVLVALAVMMIVRIAGARAAQRRNAPPAGPARGANPPAVRPAEAMVRCAHCGIHLPRSEAVLQNGQTWCSTDHARLGKPGA